MITNPNEKGIRASLIFGAIRELNELWQTALDGEIEIPLDTERWYNEIIDYACRHLSEATINAGTQEVFKETLSEAEQEIECMGMFFTDDYNPFTDFADIEPDSIPVGGHLYVWRVYHPNNWKPDKVSAKEYTESPASVQHQYLIHAEDGQGRFDGYLIGTLTNDMPPLSEYWASKGWRIESKGSWEKVD